MVRDKGSLLVTRTARLNECCLIGGLRQGHKAKGARGWIVDWLALNCARFRRDRGLPNEAVSGYRDVQKTARMGQCMVKIGLVGEDSADDQSKQSSWDWPGMVVVVKHGP